jgi:hypothetical protein
MSYNVMNFAQGDKSIYSIKFIDETTFIYNLKEIQKSS